MTFAARVRPWVGGIRAVVAGEMRTLVCDEFGKEEQGKRVGRFAAANGVQQ